MLSRGTPSITISGAPKPRMSIEVLNWPGSLEFCLTRSPATLPVSMFWTFSFLVVMISSLLMAEMAPVREAFFWVP